MLCHTRQTRMAHNKEDTHQLVMEQSRKRKRSLDLKGKSIQSISLDDFPQDSANKEVN